MSDADIEALATRIFAACDFADFVDRDSCTDSYYDHAVIILKSMADGNYSRAKRDFIRDRLVEFVRPLREQIAGLERELDEVWQRTDSGECDGN